MKLTTQLIAAAAAALALCSQANAALIFNGSYTTAPGATNSYIGVYNSANNDSALYDNGTLGLGAFTQTWVFSFGPGGSLTTNANFIPGFPNPNSIQNFQVSLFSAAGTTGCSGPTGGSPGNPANTAGTCTSLSLGLAPLFVGSNSGNSSSIGFSPLVAGLYAIVVTGTVVSTPTLYSGQLVTSPVPEPTSLALVGLALCGLGYTLRKKA